MTVKEVVNENSKEPKIDTNTVLLSFNNVLNLKGIKDKIESVLHELDYEVVGNFDLSKYHRKIFENDDFRNIALQRQYSKGKNRAISLMIYEYSNDDSTNRLLNEIVSSKHRDGIFKSGAIFFQHSNHLLYLAGTCSIEKSAWDQVEGKLKLDQPYLMCWCGGMCSLKENR